MKRVWMRMLRRKWLVAVGAMVVFLSVGAAAWAASGDGSQPVVPDSASAAVATPVVLALAETSDTEQLALDTAGKPGPKLKEALKEKRQQRMKRIEALMKLVREQMSPEDQATYDRLVQTAKDQRAALQQAKEDLGKTLKELRELTKEYLDAVDGAGGPAGSSTTAQ